MDKARFAEVVEKLKSVKGRVPKGIYNHNAKILKNIASRLDAGDKYEPTLLEGIFGGGPEEDEMFLKKVEEVADRSLAEVQRESDFEASNGRPMTLSDKLKDDAISMGVDTLKVMDMPRAGAAMGITKAAEAMGAAPEGVAEAAYEQWRATGFAPENVEMMEAAGAPVPESGVGKFLVNVVDPGLLAGAAKGAVKTMGKKGLLHKAGKNMFRSAFKKADEVAQKMGKGKHAFSDLALEKGFRGTADAVAEQATKEADTLLKRQKVLLKNMDNAATKAIEPDKLLKPVYNTAKKIADPNSKYTIKVRAQAQQVLDQLEDMMTGGPLTPSEASSYKTQIYSLLGDGTFNELARTPKGKQLFRTVADLLKKGVERSNKTLGKELKQVNKEMGILLTSKKVLSSEAGKEIAKNALTSIDAPLLMADPTLGAVKKLADISKTARFRTAGGKLLMSPVTKGAAALAKGAGGIGVYKGVQESARRPILQQYYDPEGQ